MKRLNRNCHLTVDEFNSQILFVCIQFNFHFCSEISNIDAIYVYTYAIIQMNSNVYSCQLSKCAFCCCFVSFGFALFYFNGYLFWFIFVSGTCVHVWQTLSTIIVQLLSFGKLNVSCYTFYCIVRLMSITAQLWMSYLSEHSSFHCTFFARKFHSLSMNIEHYIKKMVFSFYSMALSVEHMSELGHKQRTATEKFCKNALEIWGRIVRR